MKEHSIRLRIPAPGLAAIDVEAKRLGLSRTAYIQRAVGIARVVDDARANGRYVGATQEREALDVVLSTPA